jgi:hypothetical protein
VSGETGFDFFVRGTGIEIMVVSAKADGTGFVNFPGRRLLHFLRIRIFKKGWVWGRGEEFDS